MKATELMIGDWVYDKVLKSNARVEALQPLTIKCDIHTQKHICDEFEPVKLTPKILEMNGWKLRRGYPTEYEFIRSDYVHCYYDVKHKHCVIEVWEEICVDILLDTVHTLQHALRLCGLDELATNFKI